MKSRSNHLRYTVFLLLVGLFIRPSSIYAADQLFDLAPLGQELAKKLMDLKVKKVAVTAFYDMNGNTSPLGNLIAEEVTAGLFRATKIQVIERAMLDKVMHEQSLQSTGLIDQNDAKRLGHVLGVDALIVGSWANFGQSLRINSRIVSVESGEIMDAIPLTINRSEEISKLENNSSDKELPNNNSVYAQINNFQKDTENKKQISTIKHWGQPYPETGSFYIVSETGGMYKFSMLTGPRDVPWEPQLRSADKIITESGKSYSVNFETKSNTSFPYYMSIQPLYSPNGAGALTKDNYDNINAGDWQSHSIPFAGNSNNRNSLLHLQVGYAPSDTVLYIRNVVVLEK